MLKKGQQKSSMRFYDRVLVRKRVKNKYHDHVQKLRAFSKGRTVSEPTLTLIRRVLTESRDKIVFRHSLQTIITRVVRKLYPRDTKHIHNNLRYEDNARTLNARDEMRY